MVRISVTRPRAVALLSGGLDSTISFLFGRKICRIVMALTFDYGQRAAKREIASARKIAARYRIPHRVLNMHWLREFTSSFLVKGKKLSSDISDMWDIKNLWIPNRNALFISAGAAVAEGLGCELVITGFNAEEAVDFPDNTGDFVKAMNTSLRFSTLKRIRVISYTQNLRKHRVVTLGEELKAPWELIHSCYLGGRLMCGKCMSCTRLIEAAEDTSAWRILKKRFAVA